MGEIESSHYNIIVNSSCRHELLIDAKTGGQSWREQDICIVSRHLLYILLMVKGKPVTLQWETLADTTFTKKKD